MSKNAALMLILIFLIASYITFIQTVKAQNQIQTTTISDYGINPSLASIQQSGITYTLTGQINGILSVKKNNIILDGNGNTIAGALLLDGVSNVTAKSINIRGGIQFGEVSKGVFSGIYLTGTSNAIIANNTITEISDFVLVFANYETVAGIIVSGGASNKISGNNLVNNWEGMVFSNTASNLITENNIASNATVMTGYHSPGGIYFDHASNNMIYHNNFLVNAGGQAGNSYYDSVNVWDNGYPSGGNYWSDYHTKYSNAQEIDSSGIGNTPYIVSSNNSDNFPLLKPFTNKPLENVTPSTPPSPSSTQHPTINTGAKPPQTKLFPTMIIAAAAITVALAVAAGLLVYHKKRRHGLVAV